MLIGVDSNSVYRPGQINGNPFNKQVILERRESQFAGAQNQSLPAGVLEGIFESLWQAWYPGTTSYVTWLISIGMPRCR
jgi:hypothetical protein